MAVIREFIAGSCRHPECVVIKGGSFRSREFPSRAYLVEAAGERILWDTGYSQHFFRETRLRYRPYRWVTPVTLDRTHDLAYQMRAAGIEPASITTVAISHFHADHVAGLADFPNAQVIASEEAWESIRGRTGLAALLRGHVPGLVPEEMVRSAPQLDLMPVVPLHHHLWPFKCGWALTKDESVIAVPLPGHAKGHIGCFVHTDRGWELLAFDAAWDHRAYRELRGPSRLSFIVQDNQAAYYETLKKLRELHRRRVRIHLSHEPAPD